MYIWFVYIHDMYIRSMFSISLYVNTGRKPLKVWIFLPLCSTDFIFVCFFDIYKAPKSNANLLQSSHTELHEWGEKKKCIFRAQLRRSVTQAPFTRRFSDAASFFRSVNIFFFFFFRLQKHLKCLRWQQCQRAQYVKVVSELVSGFDFSFFGPRAPTTAGMGIMLFFCKK